MSPKDNCNADTPKKYPQRYWSTADHKPTRLVDYLPQSPTYVQLSQGVCSLRMDGVEVCFSNVISTTRSGYSKGPPYFPYIYIYILPTTNDHIHQHLRTPRHVCACKFQISRARFANMCACVVNNCACASIYHKTICEEGQQIIRVSCPLLSFGRNHHVLLRPSLY